MQVNVVSVAKNTRRERMNGTCNIDLTHNIMTGKPVLDFVDDRVFHRSMIPTELLPPAQHRIRMSQHVCMFYKKHEVLFDQVKIEQLLLPVPLPVFRGHTIPIFSLGVLGSTLHIIPCSKTLSLLFDRQNMSTMCLSVPLD